MAGHKVVHWAVAVFYADPLDSLLTNGFNLTSETGQDRQSIENNS